MAEILCKTLFLYLDILYFLFNFFLCCRSHFRYFIIYTLHQDLVWATQYVTMFVIVSISVKLITCSLKMSRILLLVAGVD